MSGGQNKIFRQQVGGELDGTADVRRYLRHQILVPAELRLPDRPAQYTLNLRPMGNGRISIEPANNGAMHGHSHVFLAHWCPAPFGGSASVDLLNIHNNNVNAKYFFTAMITGCLLEIAPHPAGVKVSHHHAEGTECKRLSADTTLPRGGRIGRRVWNYNCINDNGTELPSTNVIGVHERQGWRFFAQAFRYHAFSPNDMPLPLKPTLVQEI